MFLTYLRRELRRRRRQTLIVAFGLALAIGLTVTVGAASTGVQAAQKSVLHSLYGVGTDISVTQQADEGTGGPRRFHVDRPGSSRQSFAKDRVTAQPGLASMDEKSVARLTRQAHVATAAGGLSLTDLKIKGRFAQNAAGGGRGRRAGPPTARPSQPPIDVDTYSIAGVDLSSPGVGPLSSVSVTSGRSFTGDDADTVAVLADSFARQRSLAKGDTLTISGTSFTVIGLVSVPSGSKGSDVYVPLTAAQKLADMPGKVTTIYVRATGATAVAQAGEEIQRVLPNATVTTSADLADQISGSLSSAASLAGTLGLWLSVAVLIAAFVLAVLFTVSAVSRRVREFGTLKALGWRTRRVVGQIIGEALVQGLLGGVLGIALGLAGVLLIDRFAPTLSAAVGPIGPAAAGGPAGPRFPGGGFAHAAQQTLTVPLSAQLTPGTVVLAVALAIAGGLLAGLFGGWRAARMRPADALRRVD